MRYALVLLGVATMLLALVPSHADAAGPVCFSTDPFLDVFVWFVNGTGANQFAGSGRDTFGDRAQTVSGFTSGGKATVGYTTHPTSSDSFPVVGGGTIDLVTGTGPGWCFAPDFGSCGDFTFTAITCPSGATTDAAPDLRGTTGRVQGIAP
jgi:hypothetical protein